MDAQVKRIADMEAEWELIHSFKAAAFEKNFAAQDLALPLASNVIDTMRNIRQVPRVTSFSSPPLLSSPRLLTSSSSPPPPPSLAHDRRRT